MRSTLDVWTYRESTSGRARPPRTSLGTTLRRGTALSARSMIGRTRLARRTSWLTLGPGSLARR